MIKHMIFKSEEFRIGFSPTLITDGLEHATRQATDWMNQYYDEIDVKHVSTGITKVFAYVTVWYELKEEAGS